MNWKRTQTNPGTRYSTADGRVYIEAIEWKAPGFKNRASRGWAIFIDGDQYSRLAAMPTAIAAQQHAELPGVWADIEARMAHNVRTGKVA